MTYANISDLAADQEFQARLGACAFQEALGKPADSFTDQLIRNGQAYAGGIFAPSISTAPGFADKYASGGQASIQDLEILAAVQAGWERIADLYAVQTSGTPTP